MNRQVEVITFKSEMRDIRYPSVNHIDIYQRQSTSDLLHPEGMCEFKRKHIPIQRLVKYWHNPGEQHPSEPNKEERYIAVDYSQVEWLEAAINEDRRLLSEQVKRLENHSTEQCSKLTTHWKNIEKATFLKRLKYLFTGEFDLEGNN